MIFNPCEEKDIDLFTEEKDEQQSILDELFVKLVHATTTRKINPDNPNIIYKYIRREHINE